MLRLGLPLGLLRLTLRVLHFLYGQFFLSQRSLRGLMGCCRLPRGIFLGGLLVG